MSDSISTKQFLKELNKEVKRLGGASAAAKEWGLWPQQVSQAMTGTKLPSPTILEKLRLKPVKHINYRYERV